MKERADEVHTEIREFWEQRYDVDYDEKLLEHLSRLLFKKRKAPEEDSAGAPHDPAFASEAETARAIVSVLQLRADSYMAATGGGCRRILDDRQPPDWREFLQDEP